MERKEEIKLCPVCKGRGEVAAGISVGVKEYGPVMMGYDWRGNPVPTRCCEPVQYLVNPAAFYHKDQDVWLLQTNPHTKLWGIAICRHCRGTGIEHG